MYLGIDIGTSSVKTVLFDRDQRLVGQASHPLEVSRPAPGWSEQDPEAWWRGVEATVGALARDHGLKGLRGIGLSGQMHGAVCLDHDDEVLRPAILWNDGRAVAECAEIEAAFPRAREVAGNIAMPGFTAPKLLWLRKHEPEVWRHIDTVLLPKDYVRFRLTGHHVSEMSDAAGTYWLDVAARDWSDDLLEATGLTRASSWPSSPTAGGSRDRSWWRAAPATTRRRPAGSGWCGRARPSSRSAPRGCSSSRTPGSRRTRQARCTPSATRSRTPGTRWG
jgi:xylulokinase